MPFYFAWCDAEQPFDATMLREDEIAFAFDLVHQEGQVPTLTLDIKNPHIGLLAPGRPQWVWLSYEDQLGNVTPLFNGWLVGLPTNLLAEIVTLQFVARPGNYLAQKQNIANGLMVEPWYDPIWVDQSKWGDPDTVLETYAMAWHVDRVSHEVSVSDILFGEDGTKEFQQEESFYDSVSISFAQSPQTQVLLDATVQWTQAGTGVIKIPDTSLSAWNGQQIVNDWPKPGNNLGGGWKVEESAITNWSDSTANNNPTVIYVGGTTVINNYPPTQGTANTPLTSQDVYNALGTFGPIVSQVPAKGPGGAHSCSFTWNNPDKEHFDGDTLSLSESVTYNDFADLGGVVVSTSISFKAEQSLSFSVSWVLTYGVEQQAPPTAPPAPATPTEPAKPITIPSLFGQLSVRYDLSFPRTETMKFVMNSDIQPIVLMPPDAAINQIKISMHGADLGLPIDPGGALPIGDPGRASFFNTDRGLLAVQYPMLVARAHLAQSARAVKVAFDCEFESALDLSCRMNALLHDPRLPGGQIIGKITEYHLKADGDKGVMIGTVQIESTIGNGTSIVENDGTPTYVDDGFVVPGYQYYTDASISLPTGDANIVMPAIGMSDVGGLALPLTFNEAVLAYQVHQGTPVDVVVAGNAAQADPTWLEIVLQPVTGQKFETDYDFGVSTVVLPKLIDLAATNA